VFLKRSHRQARPGTPMWHITFESPGHVLSLEKNPASPRLAQLRKLHLKLKNFFQPAGFFTEMLRFDKKIHRNISEISLQLLKLLSIKKRDILEKSLQNKIFRISGFNGGHRNDKKSPGKQFMLEIPMSDPLVYSQTTVPCYFSCSQHRLELGV
jgi:hypothetical protein